MDIDMSGSYVVTFAAMCLRLFVFSPRSPCPIVLFDLAGLATTAIAQSASSTSPALLAVTAF